MSKKRRTGKPVVKNIRGVGKRCVLINKKGQWKFKKNIACGLKKKSR
jgi:hypothetical protein